MITWMLACFKLETNLGGPVWGGGEIEIIEYFEISKKTYAKGREEDT